MESENWTGKCRNNAGFHRMGNLYMNYPDFSIFKRKNTLEDVTLTSSKKGDGRHIITYLR